MSRIERFKKHQVLKVKFSGKPLLHKVGPQEKIDAILQGEIDESRLSSLDYGSDLVYSLDADPTEIKALLSEISGSFNKERLERLMADAQHDLLQSIAGPFGLGKVISAYDLAGGNVTTTHNFEKGVTATLEDAKRYSEWERSSKDFNRDPYDYDIKLNRAGLPVKNDQGNFQTTSFNTTKKKEIFTKMEEGAPVVDGYTKKVLGKKIKKDDVEKYKEIDLEHITSVKEIETNSKNHLFAKGKSLEERQNYRVDLARDDNNLTLVDGSLNSSKGCKDLKEWMEKKSSNDNSKTNAEYYEVNSSLAEIEYKKSKDFLEKNILKEQVKKQGKETVVTGITEGAKMATQQAFGLLLTEFFTNSFIEINAAFNHGLEGESLYQDICIRLKRVGMKTSSKWKYFFEAGIAGLISGFISNITTFLINIFATTSKRLVRMIREGLFSLFKALKILISPPQGMTYKEAAHEAMKLLVAGGLIATGIVLEEFVEKLVMSIPFLIPIAHIVTAVIVGSITVIVTAIFIYFIDQLDLLNVIKIERDKYIIENLDNDIKEKLQNCELIVAQIEDYIFI
jgi:hypothetical protein